MSDFVIYHNPRCSKSRATLALLEEHGIEPTIVEYLDEPPSAARLTELLGKLGLSARQLMRRKEAPYASLGLADVEDEAALIRAMVEHPILIERPIVEAGDRAVLGRPPENVLALLD